MDNDVPCVRPPLMRGTGDTGIKGPHDPSHGALQLHIHPRGVDIALGGDAQRPFDGHHIVHGGNHKLGLDDEALFDLALINSTSTCGTS